MQPEAPAPAKVPDLMAALEASLAAVKDARATASDEDDDAKDGKRTARSPLEAAAGAGEGDGRRAESAQSRRGPRAVEPHARRARTTPS